MNSVIISCEAQTDVILRRLGLLILVWRKQLSLTQSELADRTGLLQSYISSLETGAVDPRISTLCKILYGLNNIPFPTFFEGPPGLIALEYPPSILSLAYDDGEEQINFH